MIHEQDLITRVANRFPNKLSLGKRIGYGVVNNLGDEKVTLSEAMAIAAQEHILKMTVRR